MIVVTADFLIDRRRKQWDNHKDIKIDEGFTKGVAYELTINKGLREEVIDYPEKLIELCFVIVDKNKKAVPFFLNQVQHEFIDILNKSKNQYENGKMNNLSFLILKGRQQGFTTLITAYQLSSIITRGNFEGLTLSDKSTNSDAIFQNKAKFMYNRLPTILKPTEKYNSKKQLLFEKLNSSWEVNTATKDVGRSRTINFFHGSEAAFWKDGISEIQAGLGESFTKSAVKIYESTANGFNDFRTMWKSNENINCFFEWWKTPEYRLNFETKNMRTKFLNDIYRRKGEWIYDRLCWLKLEKQLDENQLYWYYKKYQSYIDKELIKQEYPCTPDEAFIASGKCYFDSELIIKKIDEIESLESNGVLVSGYFKYSIVTNGDRKRITDIEFVEDKNGFIQIYKKPKVLYPYVLGGDTAGEGSDFFTGTVIDNTNSKIVAKIRIEKDETEYTRQMYCLGWYYNKALVGIECNFSTYPNKMLSEEYEYPNLYIREKEDDYTGKKQKSFGFRTDRNTRPLILAELQRIFNEEIDNIVDVDILKEGLVFVKNEKGRPEALVGCHDDLIMCTAITYYISGQQVRSVAKVEKKELQDVYEALGFKDTEYDGDYGSSIKVF